MSSVSPNRLGADSTLLLALPGRLSELWLYANHKYSIGNAEISLAGVFTGLVVLVLAVFLSRAVGRLIERRIASRTYISAGLRFTIARLANYLLFALGALYALKAAFGLDLTSIAVIFGALSFGIGFGLQYIAADVASGFILLFERPVRVGDYVTIGEDEGTVQSINLRTTTLLNRDANTVLLPNSRIVSQRVVNWSYGNERSRLPVVVTLPRTADLTRWTELLLQAGSSAPGVLPEPAPEVQCTRMGDLSVELTLSVWIADPPSHDAVRSAIYMRLSKAEAGLLKL